MEFHQVINATTGRVILEGATTAHLDRWYDHHCFHREPRAIEEVKPELRDAYKNRDAYTHFVVED